MIGVRPVVIVFEPIALSEAGHIEPVPGPAFAVGGAGQESIEQLAVCFRAASTYDVDRSRRRRETGEIEVRPTYKGPHVGLGIRREAVNLERGEHKSINRVANPRRDRKSIRGGFGQGKKRPVLARCADIAELVIPASNLAREQGAASDCEKQRPATKPMVRQHGDRGTRDRNDRAGN